MMIGRLRRAAMAFAAVTVLLLAGGGTASASATGLAPASTASSCVTWWVNTNGVNFRTGPGTNYASKGLLYYPDGGTKLASTLNWVKIRLMYRSKTGLPVGTTGWVYASYGNPCVPVDMT